MQQITINCHSSICIGGDVYIDPFKIQDNRHNAKCIFITHSHFDHLDVESINKLSTNDTLIIATSDSIKILQEAGFVDENLRTVAPYDSGITYDVKYTTFPAYNINKKFHPKENGWVGYTLTINGLSYTICGDSDKTPELENIKTDILLVPVGGTYTMNAQEAATLTNIIKPQLVIPTHYGSVVGTANDGKIFCDNVSNVQTKILIK